MVCFVCVIIKVSLKDPLIFPGCTTDRGKLAIIDIIVCYRGMGMSLFLLVKWTIECD